METMLSVDKPTPVCGNTINMVSPHVRYGHRGQPAGRIYR